MPFQKKYKTFDFTCSFSDSFWIAIRNASKFLRVCLSFGATIRISHANKWPKLLNKCLAGSVFFMGLLCSLQRFSTFLSVSPTYSSGHEHLPLYMTQEVMSVLAFDFKQWFYLSCYPFYCSSVTLIGKYLNFLNKIFRSIFVFFTIWYFN